MVDGQNAHAPDLAALLGAAIVVLLTLRALFKTPCE